MNLINYKSILQNLLEEFGLLKYSAKISQECHFNHYLFPQKVDKNPESENNLRTKFGGSPLVPKDFVWPKNLGFPMSFVMQIDLADIYHFKKDNKNLVPKNGLIYIFWDQRQICDDFSNWQDSPEVIEEFQSSLKKVPNFTEKTLRFEKGAEYRVVYLPKDQTKNLKIAKNPVALYDYIFYTSCFGIVQKSRIYEEYSLLPIEKLHIPSPTNEFRNQNKMTVLEFEKYLRIYNYWQKQHLQNQSSSIGLFPAWEESVLLEIDESEQLLPFPISLNPDLYCDYLSISIQDFDKVPNFKLDYNLEIID